MSRRLPPWRDRVRIPAVLLAACLAFGSLLALWSVAVPLLEAPDEPDHLALVLHLADGEPYPSYDGLQSPQSVYDLCYVYVASIRACPRPGEVVTPTATRRHPRDEAPSKSERPTWDDGVGGVPVGALNQMPQHPPLYYQAMAAVLRVERALNGGPWSLDRELALLRLANAVLLAPLPLVAWWAARRFGLDQATSLAACFAVFAVPMLTHIGSTLNNDNLLTLCGALLVALLAGVLRGDRSVRTGALVGLVTGVALLTKAFAVVFPVLIALAYVLGAREPSGEPVERRERAVAVLRPLGVAGAVTVLAAAWWYVGVRLRTGSFTPTVEDQALPASLAPEGFDPHLGGWIGSFLVTLHNRFWGSFGWFSVRFTGPLTVLASLVVVVGVVSALAGRSTPGSVRGAPSRLARAWFLVPTFALAVLVAGRSWGIYRTTGQLIFAQGRYLFAGLVGLLLLVSIGFRRWFGRATPAVVLGAAALFQLHALRRSLSVYWGLSGLSPRGQVHALMAYSGWPGPFVALVGGLAALAGVLLVCALANLARPVRSTAP